MLWHYCHIVQALYDLQLALEVLCLVEQGGFLVAFRVGLWCVHIAFAIHHLIPVPVDNRSSCHTYLEDLRIVGHQRYGHESSETPSVNAYSVSIHIGKGLEIFHTLHLVLHLYLSELTEGGLFESFATVLASTVVEDEEQIALLCHVGLPTTAAVVPAGVYVVGMRSTVYIYNGGIFFGRVEVGGFHHAPVEIGLAIGRLDSAAAVFRYIVALPWVFGCEVCCALAVLCIHDGYLARHIRSRVVVIDKLTALAQGGIVPSLATVVHHGALASLGVY